MRAGRLDRLITIQRKTSTESQSGEPVESWTTIALRRPASMSPVKGDERFSTQAPELVATDQIEFRIRYSADIADLSPKDRIIHPALDEDTSPDDPQNHIVHDVVTVLEIGRREGFRIITQRRADVTA